jgi:hypothetical protein
MTYKRNPWDLYDTHPDFESATATLDRAWEDAKRISPELSSKERAAAAERYMESYMEPLAEVGAMDSEPFAIVRELVIKHFGVAGRWL